MLNLSAFEFCNLIIVAVVNTGNLLFFGMEWCMTFPSYNISGMFPGLREWWFCEGVLNFCSRKSGAG